MSSLTVADAVADELALAGVDRVFGLPGGEVLLLVEALRARGIAFQLCRHEADAGIAAAVYGTLKGTTGVVLTTLGPGASNLLMPMASSFLEREPLLAISAQIPTSWPDTYIHQRLPLLDLFRPITKLAEPLEPAGCRGLIRAAVAANLTEPHGPSFLTLSAEDAKAEARESTQPTPALRHTGSRQSPLEPRQAAVMVRELLASANKPLVAVGLGLRPQRARALRAWLERWRLNVVVTPKVKGIVDETESNFVGVIGGMAIDRLMVQALREADLIIGVGLDPVEIDQNWHAELPITWLLESPWATGAMPDDSLFTDHLGLLEELTRMDAPRQWSNSFIDIAQQRRELMTAPAQQPISPIALVNALAEALPRGTIVTTDVGSHKYLFGQFWPSTEPQTFFMSNGLSGMGYGLPAAIGAKLARPELPVLAVLGDGGFAMNGMELESAVRLGATPVVVVLADNSYSLIQFGQESRHLPRYGVDFDHIDTVAVAKACGYDALRSETSTEISAAVRDAVSANRPLLVEVPISLDSYSGII